MIERFDDPAGTVRRTESLPERGVDYVVKTAGPRCPLKVGEVVQFADSWTSDFLSGGIIVEFDVWRAAPLSAAGREKVTLRRGPDEGAILEALVPRRRSVKPARQAAPPRLRF